ncbi:GH10611 [Drosophila grimshawi]|uniref:GH10611 n=2 Tax=Drosophila grimshawi TaxID=7222 RepID=B4JCY4_DROGR|nr:GH10611 [Drosophila grimshawi]
MKLFVALLALVAYANAAAVGEPIDSHSISSTVVDVIEGMKEQMPCGFPGLGIPPIAPLRIDHKNIDIDTETLKMKGSIEHFRLNGLNDFDIDEMKVNAITSKVTYKFNFRDVNVDTTYDMDMLLKKYGFTIKMIGAGHAKFAIKDMTIWGTLKYSLGVISGKLKLKSLDVRTHLGEVDSEIEGMLGDGNVNEMMNEYLAEAVEMAINENEDMIAETIEQIALPAVNSVLEEVSIGDIIAGGDGEGGEKEVCIPPELDW